MTRLERWWPKIRFCVVAFLVLRVLVCALAIVAWHIPDHTIEAATYWHPQRPGHAWLNAFAGLERYDAQWYLQIASHGYENGNASSAYFPLYPMLIRLVAFATGGHWLLAGYLVSNGALLLALVLLYELTTREISEQAARATILLLLFNPMSFFLVAPYSESLFLLLSVACLRWVRQGRWGAATGAAFLASATRSTGIVLGLAMAVEALHQVGWRPYLRVNWKQTARTLPWCALAPMGITAYLLYWQARDHWRVPLDSQSTDFHRHATWPWNALADGTQLFFQTLTRPGWLIMNVSVATALCALALGVVAIRRFPPLYGTFTAASLILPLCLTRTYAPLTSVARYDLVIFPVFWALACVVQRRSLRWGVIGTGAVLMSLLTLLFASWHDVL